jgi:hypothetical protein
MKLYTLAVSEARHTNEHAHTLTTHDQGHDYSLTTQVASHV